MLRRDQKYVGEIEEDPPANFRTRSAARFRLSELDEITAKLKNIHGWNYGHGPRTAQQTAAYGRSMMKTFRGFEPVMADIAQASSRLYKQLMP
jgi:hypothetical protein